MPVEVSQLRPVAQEYHAKVKKFIEEHILPIEREIAEHGASDKKWEIPPVIEQLKVRSFSRQEEGFHWNSNFAIPLSG